MGGRRVLPWRGGVFLISGAYGMGKFNAFILGLLLGFGLYHVASNFHLIRTPNGVEWVRKVSPSFRDSYADIRTYTVSEWAEHPELAAALLKEKRAELMRPAGQQAVSDAVDGAIDRVLDKVGGQPEEPSEQP